MPRPDWIFGHDPQEYAYEEFETAAHAVETGCEYTPRNIPPPGVNHRTDDFDGTKVKSSLSKTKANRINGTNGVGNGAATDSGSNGASFALTQKLESLSVNS
jgi:hypothetical protein